MNSPLLFAKSFYFILNEIMLHSGLFKIESAVTYFSLKNVSKIQIFNFFWCLVVDDRSTKYYIRFICFTSWFYNKL